MIQWKDLTSEERNALVHEKVMGISEAATCTGALIYESTDIRTQYAFYRCRICGTKQTVTDYFLRALGVPKEHTITLPRYSESLGAAWRIVEHMHLYIAVHVASAPFQYEALCMDRRMNGKSFQSSAETAAEAICIAALRACGQEVDDAAVYL